VYDIRDREYMSRVKLRPLMDRPIGNIATLQIQSSAHVLVL
jgi:hypothetical protein